MRRLRQFQTMTLAIAGLAVMAISSYSPRAAAQAVLELQPVPLVRGVVDDGQRVTLKGNVHPMARPKYDLGRVEDGFAANRLYLLLRRSGAQEQALERFLEEAHTAGSPGYHKWLTPVEFGKRFGAADSDIAAVTAWLEGHGFTVNKLHPGRIALEFSGNAAQVKAAFHTEIHRYGIKGATYYANATDPQIPAALAGVVAGVSPLHSFHAQPMVKVAGRASYNPKTHVSKPEWTYPNGGGYISFQLGPQDFALQYDINSVYAAGTKGAGQSIGILSVSNIDLNLVAAYQTLFGLPANVPTVVVDGNDPGENTAATEAYLDVEESGAIAPAAKVVLYASEGSVLTDPLVTSGLRALDDNQVGVISMSYGTCEASLGASGNGLWLQLWQEAAAQGITGFVSSGDGGSAGCDNFDTEAVAVSGLGVNGLGSTPYNVSVGGTDFYYSNYAVGGSALNTQIQSYWSYTGSTTPALSLLQVAPEQPWNNALGLNATTGGLYNPQNSSIVAGSGGSSSAAVYPKSGPVTGYAKPAWQKGAGVPADGVRDLPDVSLYAANGPNYIYYPICASQGDCVNTRPGTGAVYITSVGGTSASSPAMAGIQALINQATGSWQGQADFVYYALANKTLTAKPFRDITVGSNQVPCMQGSPNCVLATTGPGKGYYVESGYGSTAGYDRATGLGTVDVANLIKNWSMATFKPTTTTLAITPTSFAHGTTVSATSTVAPKTGTGTPTGTVGLRGNDAQDYGNVIQALSLAGGTVTASLNNLPGGTYQVVSKYTGDGTFGASTSAPVTVTVTAESDTLTTSGWVLNPMDYNLYPLVAGMAIPYGSQVWVDASILGGNEAGSPLKGPNPAMGAVTFTDKVGTVSKASVVALNSQGVAEWAPTSLAIGSHGVSAAYAGDASYAVATAPSAASLNVFKGNTSMYVLPYETKVKAGSNVTVNVEMNPAFTPIVGSLPTGVVTVNLGGMTKTAALTAWGSKRDSIQNAVVTFTNVPAGILPLTASYAGDANWYGTAATYGSVNSLATLPAPQVTLTATTTTYLPNQLVQMTGKVIVPSGQPLPTGFLYFEWRDLQGYYYYYYYTLQPGAGYSYWNLTFPANLLGDGVNQFVATFKGDANYSAQSSLPLAITLSGSDFSLTTTTQQVPVAIGGTGAGSVMVSPLRAYTGTVAVTCLTPTGITCTPTTASPTVGGGVTDGITLKAASTVKAGFYPAVVTATGQGHVHTAEILVAVH